MKIYIRGATAKLRGLSYNSKTNAATTPDTSITITVKDPTGTAVVDDQNMTNDDTGDHSYGYDIAADAVLGEYEYVITAVHSNDTSKLKRKFVVEADI